MSAAAHLLVWLLPAILLGLVLMAGSLMSLRRQRNCPGCAEPMTSLTRDLPGSERPSYEVLVCEGCSNAATLVHGHKSRFAYCPSCLNRSLRTPCMRLDDGSVKVAETCEICGFKAEHVVGGARPSRPMGQVIPFPVHRVRPPERADDG